MKPTKTNSTARRANIKDAICHQGGGNPLLEIQRG